MLLLTRYSSLERTRKVIRNSSFFYALNRLHKPLRDSFVSRTVSEILLYDLPEIQNFMEVILGDKKHEKLYVLDEGAQVPEQIFTST